MIKFIGIIGLIILSLYLMINYWYAFLVIAIIGIVVKVKMNGKNKYKDKRLITKGINHINFCSSGEIPEEFIVLDVETTGLDPAKHEIIEIAILKYVRGEKVESFSTLIKPYNSISKEITKINGITNKMVKSAPRFKEVCAKINSYISESKYIVGYNVTFDIRFTSAALGLNKHFIEEVDVIDVLEFTRKHFSDLPNRKLETMKDYFGIQQESHRSEIDCETTVDVWKKSIEEVNNRELRHREKMDEILSLMNEKEQMFIASLREQLGELAPNLKFNTMSDRTINFKIDDCQIGRVKLAGRKFKMQIIDENNVLWLDIEDIGEATTNIKHWVKYTKTLTKIS